MPIRFIIKGRHRIKEDGQEVTDSKIHQENFDKSIILFFSRGVNVDILKLFEFLQIVPQLN